MSDLERAGMVPDAVIPIVVEESVVAILAVAGSAGRMDRDRPYASMLADLVANAFQISLAIEALEQRAMTDPLTGLYNRAYLADRFLVELRRARNYGFPMSVALFDIDRFKGINDRYGHLAGDAVLRKLASFLRERTRSTDAVVRYGGEEFAVLMATADSDVAFQQADRIREEFEKTRVRRPRPGGSDPGDDQRRSGHVPAGRADLHGPHRGGGRRGCTTPRRTAETGSPLRGRSTFSGVGAPPFIRYHTQQSPSVAGLLVAGCTGTGKCYKISFTVRGEGIVGKAGGRAVHGVSCGRAERFGGDRARVPEGSGTPPAVPAGRRERGGRGTRRLVEGDRRGPPPVLLPAVRRGARGHGGEDPSGDGRPQGVRGQDLPRVPRRARRDRRQSRRRDPRAAEGDAAAGVSPRRRDGRFPAEPSVRDPPGEAGRGDP